MLGWTTFEKYDINIVTLLEEIQINWLIEFINTNQIHDLSIILNHYPHIHWFLSHKAPSTRDALNSIKEMHSKSDEDIQNIVQRFLPTIEDWLVYVINPHIYDNLSFNKWDSSELLSITNFEEKTVVDVGAGTGSQTFRMAPLARTIYAVEPIANNRKYIKTKCKENNINNVYVVDGLLQEIPFEDAFADIVVGGHVFGDHPEEEFLELMRVIKPGGIMILMPGNNDTDNDIHTFLTNKGCSWGSFLEPGPDPTSGMKRKYWIVK